MAVKPIPEGYTRVTPYLVVDDGKAAIEFYKRALGATERAVMHGPDGMVAHAELQIGDARVMLSDKFPQSTVSPPKELGGTTVGIWLFVEDVDSVVQDAADAGATITAQPEDQFWGDRLGQVTDPYGHVWHIAKRVEELTSEEIEARGREFMASMG
jgi:PhnB protein